MAVSVRGPAPRNVFSVLAGATVTLDANEFSSFFRRKYVIDANIVATNKYRAFEILCSKKGIDVTDGIYSKIGDPINLVFNFSKVATEAVLAVTNNELVTVEIGLTKIA